MFSSVVVIVEVEIVVGVDTIEHVGVNDEEVYPLSAPADISDSSEERFL